jgi:hypothetical protein
MESEFIALEAVNIDSEEILQSLADDLRLTAMAYPLDDNPSEQIKDATLEQHGELVKVKGYSKELEKYTRFITFDGGKTPPYQISFYFYKSGVENLVIVDYGAKFGHRELHEAVPATIAAFFWNYGNEKEWKSIKVHPTPRHVAFFYRVIDV